MAQEFGRMELTDPDAAGDGWLDLTLRLSVGGSFRKAAERGGKDLLRSESAGASGGANADLRGGDLNLGGSGAPSFFCAAGGGDPQRRMCFPAARRKREEKQQQQQQQQQRKGIRGEGGGCGCPARACSVEDRMVLEAQELQSRARDREARENEAPWADRRPLGKNCGRTPIPSPSPKPDPHAFPVTPMQYPYHQVQYVSVVNGFGVPCLIPCWVPAISSAADGSIRPERNVHQPEDLRFPAPALQFKGRSLDSNDGEGNAIKPAPSLPDSPGCSSSGISVHQSDPLHGGSCSSGGGSSSSEAKSDSSLSVAEKPGAQATPSSQVSNPQGHSGQSVASSIQGTGEGVDKPASSTAQSRELEGATSVEKPISADPPPPSLPRMPRVSTTGNGPNGKTITGVLYRYSTESGVSIVCVCHGTAFSPAEFVRHAGSTDASHPLRQIVVLSS